MMKALIINFNRLTLPKNMAEWLAAHGCTPVFIDNGSDYPPLLEYYALCPFEVIRLGANYGHTVLWQDSIQQTLHAIVGDDRYIVTDPDLDLTGVPADFLKVMHRGLDLYAIYDKCGLSLEINDLPATEEGNLVRTRFELKYWMKPLDEMYYHADTDTTFAMYREGVKVYSINGIRTNRPYTARHLPWYYTSRAELPVDEQYYFSTANSSSSGKDRLK
jgi:hypothetical protein